MPFGLCNAPATFQRAINSILRKYLDVFACVYLDDILIYLRSEQDHIGHVKLVLRALEEAHFFVKGEKCDWHVSKTEFLGYILSGDGIEMDPSKISSITSWPEPKNVHDLQVFLGFANFYRNQVGYFARGAKQLYKLLKKNTAWEWTDAHAIAFQTMKDSFVTAPIKGHFDPTRDWIMETDSSGGALGAVLLQYQEDGFLHPVAYHSQSLAPAELNYKIHNKELLAIVDSLRKWRVYLCCNPQEGTIFTDHKNLIYFTERQVLSQRHARWHMTLCKYNFHVIYCAGKANVKADALSQRSDL